MSEEQTVLFADTLGLGPVCFSRFWLGFSPPLLPFLLPFSAEGRMFIPGVKKPKQTKSLVSILGRRGLHGAELYQEILYLSDGRKRAFN